MADRAFFPAAGVWHVWPKLDERVFGQPELFVGQQLNLSADVRSIEECRAIYTRVTGCGHSETPSQQEALPRNRGQHCLTTLRGSVSGTLAVSLSGPFGSTD